MSEDRVKLVREISRSGVATVWEGWDNSLDRKVLVKSIHPQFARDADLRIRFEREARAIARLSHPNVVQIYDIQSGPDSLTLLLEYVEGETLGHLLKRRGVLPYGLALMIVTEVLAGLEQAHASGIIHRDLKPDNILIARNGAVKITDFGLASLRDLPAVTLEGMVVGTPSYMSPEQAMGGEIGPQTDLFTCGAMFFEMLTGQRLIQGDNIGEAFQNVMKYRSPDLAAFADAIPANARRVLDELIERDPAQRLESASFVRKALLSDTTALLSDASELANFLEGKGKVEPLSAAAKSRIHVRGWYILSAALLVLTVIALTLFISKPEVHDVETAPFPVDSLVESPIDSADATEIVSAETQTPETVVGAVPARQPDSATVSPPKEVKPVPSGPAFITINSTPWARVFYNDSLLGTTPLSAPIEVPSGSGTFLFLNDQIGLPVTRQIDLSARDTTEIIVNLQESVGRVRVRSVRPWADVYVDGELKFRTPSSQVLFLPLGPHVLELRHPDLPTYRQDLVFAVGDPIIEVRVDLTKF